MGVWALVISIILYIIIAIQSYKDNDKPHAFIWFCYALANVGFLWHMLTYNNEK